MKGIRSWYPKAMAMVVMVMVGVAVMASMDSAGTATTPPGLVASESSVPCDNPGIESARPDDSIALKLVDESVTPEPIACRRAPECWADSDCDLLCGPGLGKCVHSSCPVRICKCH